MVYNDDDGKFAGYNERAARRNCRAARPGLLAKSLPIRQGTAGQITVPGGTGMANCAGGRKMSWRPMVNVYVDLARLGAVTGGNMT